MFFFQWRIAKKISHSLTFIYLFNYFTLEGFSPGNYLKHTKATSVKEIFIMTLLSLFYKHNTDKKALVV